ncbi:ATP-binding protein [Anaerovoracaceae bacterium 41-7]
MNKFIMLVGVTGSGKSYYANQLKQNKEVDEVVSSDAIRLELYGDENEQKYNNKVFNELHKRVRRLLKDGKNVCYDATNLSSRRRASFLKTLAEIDVEKECHVMLATPIRCWLSQRYRERQLSYSVVKKHVMEFNCPYYFEGWEEIKIIRNFGCAIPAEVSLAANKIPHDNPHHTLNIYEHMATAQRLYQNTVLSKDFSPYVSEALRYHDIGKRFCKTFKNSNGNESESVHYYGHQNASAYYYLLSENKNLTIKEFLYVTNLIQYHMEFFLRDENRLENLRKKIGDKMFDDLRVIHEYDMLAH